MNLEFCHLCGQRKDLQESHVWPKFAYKRYVADLSKGGQFSDLQRLQHHNQQVTNRWFCRDCEQSFAESFAARFLSKIDADSGDQLSYDGDLLRFAASISWRTAKYYKPRSKDKEAANILKEPCKRWQNYLRGRKREVGPFTQHCFVSHGETIPGKDAPWHNSLGGEIFLQERLILSRIGPLLIVGLLDRKRLSLRDINTWERSQVSAGPGIVYRISKDRRELLLTDDLVNVLNAYERGCIERAAMMDAASCQQK